MTQKETTEMKELKEEIEVLKRDLLKLTQTLENVGEAKIKASVDEIKEQLLSQIPKEQLQKLESVKEKGEEAVQALKEQQQKHPTGTLLVAAGIGFLVGRLLGGKS